MQVREAADEYSYRLLNCSPKTQRWVQEKLGVFVDWCSTQELNLEDIRYKHTKLFIQEVKSRVNPQTKQIISSYTVHGYASVVKTFLRWCREEEFELDSRAGIKKDDMPKIEEKVIEVFTDLQVKAMYAACASKRYHGWMGARNKAILAVLLGTGIRSGELLGLRLDDVHLEPYDAWIKVFGKGGKWRVVDLGTTATQALRTYIRRYRRAEPEETHVFLGRQGPLSQFGLDEVFKRLEERAGITGVRCSPHTCRHWYATNYLKEGGAIEQLSVNLGHTSVQVTEMYTRTRRRGRTGGKDTTPDHFDRLGL